VVAIHPPDGCLDLDAKLGRLRRRAFAHLDEEGLVSVLVMRQALVACATAAPPRVSEVMTVVDAISAFIAVFTVFPPNANMRPAVRSEHRERMSSALARHLTASRRRLRRLDRGGTGAAARRPPGRERRLRGPRSGFEAERYTRLKRAARAYARPAARTLGQGADRADDGPFGASRPRSIDAGVIPVGVRDRRSICRRRRQGATAEAPCVV
jgi:hypothetical protein